MRPFKQAFSLIEVLRQHGYEAYFVGGSVRDYLLNEPIGDIDIATSALPEEVMRIFPHHVPVGLEHGTVVVLMEDVPYEITTFRVEAGYDDFRRPSSVTFVRSLEEDLKRRDFTMNAIALTADGTIIDPYGGRRAIADGIIATVGRAGERFQEDALRIMRGIRFVSTLGFTIENETKTAVMEYAHLLQHIAIERIAVEFEKLLLGSNRNQALELLAQTKVCHYLPHFEQKEKQLLAAAQYNWSEVQIDIEAWAFILYMTNINDPVHMLKDWKLSNKKIKAIAAVLHYTKERFSQEWNAFLLYKAGEGTAAMAERLFSILHHRRGEEAVQAVRRACRELPIQNRRQLAVTGNELLQWTNKPAGPWISQLLGIIEQHVVCSKVTNDTDRIKEWLETCSLL